MVLFRFIHRNAVSSYITTARNGNQWYRSIIHLHCRRYRRRNRSVNRSSQLLFISRPRYYKKRCIRWQANRLNSIKNNGFIAIGYWLQLHRLPHDGGDRRCSHGSSNLNARFTGRQKTLNYSNSSSRAQKQRVLNTNAGTEKSIKSITSYRIWRRLTTAYLTWRSRNSGSASFNCFSASIGKTHFGTSSIDSFYRTGTDWFSETGKKSGIR